MNACILIRTSARGGCMQNKPIGREESDNHQEQKRSWHPLIIMPYILLFGSRCHLSTRNELFFYYCAFHSLEWSSTTRFRQFLQKTPVKQPTNEWFSSPAVVYKAEASQEIFSCSDFHSSFTRERKGKKRKILKNIFMTKELPPATSPQLPFSYRKFNVTASCAKGKEWTKEPQRNDHNPSGMLAKRDGR